MLGPPGPGPYWRSSRSSASTPSTPKVTTGSGYPLPRDVANAVGRLRSGAGVVEGDLLPGVLVSSCAGSSSERRRPPPPEQPESAGSRERHRRRTATRRRLAGWHRCGRPSTAEPSSRAKAGQRRASTPWCCRRWPASSLTGSWRRPASVVRPPAGGAPEDSDQHRFGGQYLLRSQKSPCQVQS